tara:strand:- start:127 stop:417 length:291 start_codon:yes stop_codon:yes gene_type:complete
MVLRMRVHGVHGVHAHMHAWPCIGSSHQKRRHTPLWAAPLRSRLIELPARCRSTAVERLLSSSSHAHAQVVSMRMHEPHVHVHAYGFDRHLVHAHA